MISISGISLTNQKPLPPLPTVRGLCDVEGFTRFYIGVNLSVDEMRNWTPQRITDFFQGIAIVIGTRGVPQ
jgi:hypothetical protein